MVRRRLRFSAPGSACYFLGLGDGWLDEWVAAGFDCSWVDGERGTKNDWRHTSRHVDAISRRVTDMRPRYQTSVAAADTAAPRHIPHRWAGRKETAISRLRRSIVTVDDRNSGELWTAAWFSSGQQRRPKHSFQRRKPNTKQPTSYAMLSKKLLSRSKGVTETPSSSSILHVSYKPELSFSCLRQKFCIIICCWLDTPHRW